MEQLTNIVHVRDYFDPEDSKKVKTLTKGILKKHSKTTMMHSIRLAKYANLLGNYMALSPSKLQLLEIAALLHDIGKLNIPNEILEKPGKLTDEEWKIMTHHAVDGPWIVQLTNSYKTLSQKGKKTFDYYVLPGIGDHHLFFGGGGYGVSKKFGTNISFFARVLSVLDSFDAMTSKRPYSKEKTTYEAVQELKKNSNTQFDPKIVDMFIRALHFGGLSPL